MKKGLKIFFPTNLIGCQDKIVGLDAKGVKYFWPISLIGCQHKIVAKILVDSLIPVVDVLVSMHQFTFIHER